ncbi:zinc/manganese transport system substrate-binding protein [Micrococcales bacterium KH10]|nr:zinc/manganese transport system substrate-binding protein [Micrococcales bacterium KH10]
MKVILMKRLFGLGAGLALVVALAGCGGDQGSADVSAPTSAAQQLSIVATTTQVAEFTRSVVPGGWEVTQLLAPGTSAHSFDPTAADLMAIGSADVLVTSGAGLETWLDDATTAAGFDGAVIDASEGIVLSGDHDHDHGDEGHTHDDEADDHDHDHDDDGHDHDHSDDADHADEQHDDEAAGDSDEDHTTEDDHDGDDHDHGEHNPHIWLDPLGAETMVTNIAEGLAAQDSANAQTFRDNAAAYIAKLETLDSWIAENIDAVPQDQRLLVSNHDAFHYYNDRYGVTFVGSIIPNFEDNAEPSAARLQELIDDIKELGVKAVFSETAIDPRTAEQIASSAGVEVYVGDDALYADSLGPKGSEGDTYFKSMIHNTTMLLNSWGASATEPPAELKS